MFVCFISDVTITLFNLQHDSQIRHKILITFIWHKGEFHNKLTNTITQKPTIRIFIKLKIIFVYLFQITGSLCFLNKS